MNKITLEELEKIDKNLLEKAYIKFSYFSKLFLYYDETNKKYYLKPCSVLGVEKKGVLELIDYYTLEYSKKRKKKYLNTIKTRPFQKGMICLKYANDLAKQIISLEEKIFKGFKFYDGYSAAFDDFKNDPSTRYINLYIVKKSLRKFSDCKKYNNQYEYCVGYIEFYNDLRKDKEGKKK